MIFCAGVRQRREGCFVESAYHTWQRQSVRPRRTAAARRKMRVAIGPRECRRMAQLGICILLFLVVFIGKGIFPEQMAAAREKLWSVISGNTDFRAAFSNLGRSIAEGEPVLDTLNQLWVEVLGGTKEDPAPKAVLSGAYRANSGLIRQDITATGILSMDLLKQELPPAMSPPEPAVQTPTPELPPDAVQTAPEPSAAPEPTTPAVIDMGYDGPELPEDVSMDKYDLGLAETMSPIQGVEGWWVSSDYGWREHPVDGEERFHCGVDLAVNEGTNVKAFADGVVNYIGESPIYGLYTQLDHGNGVTTFYAHCKTLLVQQGQTVSRGDVIAQSGQTGNVTGPHLHFELKKDGLFLNPLYYLDS